VTAFAAAAGASDEQLDAVRVMVAEVVTDAVRHAYPGSSGSRRGHRRDRLRRAVAPRRRRPLRLRADLPSKDHGVGLALIALLRDGFTIAKRSSGGIEMRIRFKLTEGVDGDANARPARDRASDGQSRGSVASATAPASPPFATTT
jgi:hypothetical protein